MKHTVTPENQREKVNMGDGKEKTRKQEKQYKKSNAQPIEGPVK